MFRSLAAVTAGILVALAALDARNTQDAESGPAKHVRSQPPAESRPSATGRTLQDVREEYTPEPPGVSASAVRTAPAPPPAPPRIIEAEVFALTDRNGNVRMEMGVLEGQARLRVFDTQGKARLVLSEKDGLATVAMLDDNGQEALRLSRAALVMGPEGENGRAVQLTCERDSPELRLLDRRQGSAINMSFDGPLGGAVKVSHGPFAGKLGAQNFSLSDERGIRHISMGLGEERAALYMETGDATQPRVELGCGGKSSWLSMGGVHVMADQTQSYMHLRTPGGCGEVSLSSRLEDGRPISSLLLTESGGDGRDATTVSAQTRDGKPSIQLSNEQGPPLWTAP